MREAPSYRLIAAGIILVAYFVVAGILMSIALSAGDATIANWDQVVVIFNAIGALATTASGVLFGAEIQQANVRSAQQDSQVQAAEAARTREAALQALESLEPSATGSVEEGTARARSLLHRAIAGRGGSGS